MAFPLIIDNSELRDRSGGIRLNGTNIEYIRTVQYIVDAGSKDMPVEEVLATSGLPIVSITTLGNGAVCSSKDATAFPENTRYWKVVCNFSTQATDQQTPPGQSPSPDPQTWIPVWRVSYEKIEKETIVDSTGKKLVNSAGTPFDGTIKKRKTVASFTFSQYEPDTLTEVDLEERNGVVNASSFKGFPKYSLLLEVTGSERGYFNGYRCRKVDYSIKHYKGEDTSTFKEWNSGTSAWAAPSERSGWRLLVIDRGPEYIDSGTRKPYLVNNHRTIANLNGAGAVVSGTSEPTVLAFNEYPLKDFATFIRV